MQATVAQTRWLMTVVAVWLMAATLAYAEPQPIRASIQPAEINLGESAQLTITTSGSTSQSITLPTVQGLNFGVVGQSRQLQIINGATLSSTSILVRVTPNAVGVYTIPGFTPTSQPLVLRVGPASGANNGPMQYGFGPLLPNNPAPLGHTPILPNGGSASGIRLTPDGSAFARFVLPKHAMYVGESIPVDIQIGLRQGFVNSLNGMPTLKGGEFTLNNLSHDPEKVEKLIDGQPFTILTWHSILAPVKPSVSTLTIETPLTVRVRTRSQRDSRIDDLLGDPFLQNLFGQTVIKEITVVSPPAELKVLPVPTDNRPDGYTGAVGTFKLTSELSAATTAAGDPITLKLRVTGSGNFDRVDTPMLEHLEQWKTYPPKASFNPADTTGYKGEKTFEQPLIAAHPGKQTLPALSFTYFDPDTQRFETARTAPLIVNVTGSDVTSPTVAGAGPLKPGDPAAPPKAGYRLDHHGSGDEVVASIAPAYVRTAFLSATAALALAFTGGWVLCRRRAQRESLKQSRQQQAARAIIAARQTMAAAAAAKDAAAFFTAARVALQNHFSQRFDVAADTITPASLDERLPPEDSAVRELFALADEASYSGQAVRTADYQRWTHVVQQQLDAGAAA